MSQIKRPTKTICIPSDDNTFTRGSILTLNATFLTKYALLTTAFIPLETDSAKKNHGIIPQSNHNTKGVPSSVGLDLNPTPKTNQITSIKSAGRSTAHNTPK